MNFLRVLHVEPPPEANEPLDTVWRLQPAMHRTRDAAAAWEGEYTRTLNIVGFESGVSDLVLLSCELLDASVVVHGKPWVTTTLITRWKFELSWVGGSR